MSFGGMFDGAGSGVFSYDAGGGGPGMHNPGRLLAPPPIPRPGAGAGGGGFASSTGLSLGLTNMEGGGQLGGAFMGSTGSGGDGDSLGRAREDENDSRSGSDNLDGASADELDPDNSNPRKKKKRYHRHTPQQIQELEAVFKECPHPDEKQRMELSRRLNLESRQVKFWFQNRRTQMKTQIERHENALLRQENDPLWQPSLDIGLETLNFDEYRRAFARVLGPSPAGYVSDATREVGIAIINSVDLVNSLMNEARWSEMFPCVVARASTMEIISSGMGGTRSGSIQLMRAELQVLSPLVPIREVTFLRFCKQHADGLWAIVDVSVDGVLRPDSGTGAGPAGYMGCRLLPSGCIVEDMQNGYAKVTWVVHAEYDEAAVHELYRPLLRSGQALGARRWLASLQRQCEYHAILCSNPHPNHGDRHEAISPAGRRCMLRLAQRMADNFCAGVCATAAQKWRRLDEWRVEGAGGRDPAGGEDKVRMMARQSVGAPGEPPGVVLSATTSVRLPGTLPQRVFDYLRDEQRRGEWDILANGEAMQEMDHIAKGQHHGNAVSLLRPNATSGNQNNMLILQETCTDASGSLVVYAPVDVQSMHVVMGGGDSAYVSLLPSGFAILPDGHTTPATATDPSPQGSSPNAHAGSSNNNPGSLVTVAFQILVNNLPTAKLTVESVDTVSNLLSCTIQKIKSALQASIISP
ncbi:unnamed protein product [Triticum turgidum subsp. durum]|uniref:Uncharacterized protein n=1 Tax=Triticum turgidum subsp. durum TaxID=4567 RepID=A0A9R1ANY5_TRITD|nr:unnamed protein product [Triticum turgidum subsp. durum]